MATRIHADLDVPDALSPRLKGEVERELRVQAVLALFKRHACSAGVAAKMLGMRLAEFLELLKKAALPYADDSSAAVASERRMRARLRGPRRRHSTA